MKKKYDIGLKDSKKQITDNKEKINEVYIKIK